MQIVRCVSCEGYGWFEDEFTGEAADCDWCGGTGYVYRDDRGVDRRIPPADYGRVACARWVTAGRRATRTSSPSAARTATTTPHHKNKQPGSSTQTAYSL